MITKRLLRPCNAACLCLCLLMLTSLFQADCFVISEFGRSRQMSGLFLLKKPRKIQIQQSRLVLYSDGDQRDDADSSEDESSSTERKKVSSRRIGGRRKWMPPMEKNSDDSGFPKWTLWLVPFVAAWLFIGSLFGPSDDSSFYYYQSTVVESQVRTADGSIQRSRKESVRSNVPSLMQGKGSSSKLLRESPDRDFDRQLDEMMRSPLDPWGGLF